MKSLSFHKEIITILFIFTVLASVLFWPVFLGKVNLNGNLLVSFYAPYGENLSFKNTGWDQLRIYFPFYKFTFDTLRDFEIPHWNPYAFSGHPHLADFQSAVFYPANIFGLFLPQIEFWHFLRITPIIMAAFFTFLYLRALKLSSIASFFGAFSFGFSPFILTWGEEVVMSPHSIVWLPLILFAIEKFFSTGKKLFLVLIAFSTASTFFAGYMQTTIYLFIFVAFYLWVRIGFKKLFDFKCLRLLGAFILGSLIAAIQLIPSAEIFFNSARSDIALTATISRWLLPAESVLTFLAPDFFGSVATGNYFKPGIAQYYESIIFVGIAVILFATYSVFSKIRDKQTIFMLVITVLSLSTTLDLPTSRFLLSLPIPFLSTSIPNRILFLSAFCLAILAAKGFDVWLKSNNKKIVYHVVVLAVLYSAVAMWLILVRYGKASYFENAALDQSAAALITLRNLVIPVGIFVLTSFFILVGTIKKQYRRYAAILIILLAVLHIFRFSQKYFSFSERQNIFPENQTLSFIRDNQGEFRSWSAGLPPFENNFATQYDIYWPEGFDSLNNRNYAEFTYAMQGGEIDEFIFRADAGFGRGDLEEIIGDSSRRKLVDLLGIKYILAASKHTEILSEQNFSLAFSGGEYSVFENTQVLLRTFLASNYEGPPELYFENTPDSVVNKERRKLIPEKLLSDGFNLRDVVILEKPSPISPQFGDGVAEIISYKPNEVVVETSSAEPKILYLSDNMYPGWKAEVDGKETEVLRANYTFRAVPLIGGEHIVRFYFDSSTFKLGAIISLLSLFSLGILLFRKNRLV